MPETFITEFHNIPGDTFKQKYESFYQLLHKNRTALFSDPIALSSITKNLMPENHLEKIFRTNFLIYFRRFDELYEDFKNGDEITKKKLAKEVWFYDQAFRKVTCKEFVEMLPKISYSLKITILRKLPVDEQRADEIFDSICDKYGIFLATNLITKCSSEKISDALKKFPIKLSVAQLKSIYAKDADLIHAYFESRARHEGKSSFEKYNSFFIFLAQKNPQIFKKLFKLYDFKLSLGRRTTKKFITSEKTTILDDKKKFLNVLNKSVVVRKLGPDITDLFFEIWDEMDVWRTFLKFYPKSIQFSIFKTAYDKNFHFKFGENIDSITEEILEIVSDPLERERLAKQKREKEGEDSYLKYMTPKVCWKEITEKLNSLTSTERSTYIQFVTDSCILNKDFETLLKVAELICVRFKNDTNSVRTEFLNSLATNDKILDSCDDKIWKFLVEILYTIKAKDEWFYRSDQFYYNYVKFLVENQRPLTDVVKKHYNWDNVLYYSKIKTNPKVYRAILIELVNLGLTPRSDNDDKDAIDFDCAIVALCKKYNERYVDDPFDIFANPRFVESARKILESDNRIYFSDEKMKGLEYIVQCVPELQNLYFKNFKDYGRPRGVIHFLKHNPRSVVDHFDDFMANFGEIRGINTKKFWFLIKKSTYLGLDHRSVEFCLKKLKEKENKNKEKFVRALAILQPPEEYLKLVEEYKPTCDKVDLCDEDVKDLYNIQAKMVKCLKFVDSKERVLEANFDFCRGDFLQFALTPLYSCLYKTPEVETTKFIEKLEKVHAFSVKKHSIHFVYILNDKKTVFEFLQKSNILAFIATLKYFVKNPSEELWQIVKGYIDILEKNELNLLKIAIKITVPMEYKSRFVEAIWRTLDKYNDKAIRKVLIPTIKKEVIEKLSTQFAFEVMRKSFNETDDLVALMFMFLSDENKFSEMSDILSSFKKQYFNSREDRTARQRLASFVINLFSSYMAREEGDKEFVAGLSKIFTIFPMGEAFDENVIIKCISFKNETVENNAKILINMNGNLDERYGSFAVQLLTNVMKTVVFNYIFKTAEEKIELCHCLLKRKERISDNLLILDLLPSNEPEDKKHFALYEEIMKEIRETEEEVVQLRLNLFLKTGMTRNWESSN